MDKWDYMKLKSFCTIVELVSKMKRPPTEQEKIFASCTLDKRLKTRIYMKLKKLNAPKINEPIKKWPIKLNRIFQRKKFKWTNNTWKNCSPFLAIKEMQIKPH
jgi:hypothetical protein